MPRTQRFISPTGTYHIMVRGVNKQCIFEDDEDYIRFLEILRRYKSLCRFRLFAYCIMDNHVHLLMQFPDGSPGDTIKRISLSYNFYFNSKYERVGHLFQNRYVSTIVADEAGLLAVTRYIHNNPVKAGICRHPHEYEYSSYHDYVPEDVMSGETEGAAYASVGSARIDDRHTKAAHAGRGITDTDVVFSLMSKEWFIRFSQVIDEDESLEPCNGKRRILTDREAKEIMLAKTGCDNSAAFQALSRSERDAAFVRMHDAGIMPKQMSRLTGWSIRLIGKCLQVCLQGSGPSRHS